jgi:hypothetical protein
MKVDIIKATLPEGLRVGKLLWARIRYERRHAQDPGHVCSPSLAHLESCFERIERLRGRSKP